MLGDILRRLAQLEGPHISAIRRLTDRQMIERFVRPSAGRRFFELVDLDDAAWHDSEYFGLEHNGALRELCVIYKGKGASFPPNLIATAEEDGAAMRELLEGVVPLLPSRFTAALTPDLPSPFASRYRVEHQGAFLRMALTSPEGVKRVRVDEVEPFAGRDAAEVARFFDESFPGAKIERSAVKPGLFFGIRRGGEIVSAAGTIILSKRYGVAVVAPVATRPDSRGQGLATKTCARLCLELASRGAKVIGLNVRPEITPAIRCYERLGFAMTGSCERYLLTSATWPPL